jgi:TonB-linked SusC/RagA family outer membrane protein
MKTILSSDYFLSRIVKILGEIGFVPGCLILLVLMTMSSFASAHHLPNSLKDHESFDLKTSALFNVTAHKKNNSELTPGLDEEHPHGGRISYPTFPSKLHCQPDEGRITFYLLPSTFYPITGTIYDAGGGIPGVVVKIKGTNIFTLTNEFGQFEINAKKGDILIFSYPDYETVEIKITDQTEINLELFPAVTQLEEAVINAGYYTVKDKERTGSIYKVTAKEIENQPVNNVLDALQGRVPGLDITPTTGLAGGGYTVRIRGQNSIAAGNEPLYVIDGVPFDMGSLSDPNLSLTIMPSGNINPINFIDPSSIESVEVLKDADATAIYGSRGANGVILITTKKGKSGKISFLIESSTTLISVTKLPKLLDTEQYLKIRDEGFQNDGIFPYPSTAYDVNSVWNRDRYTNWLKEFIGNTAFNHSLKFNISGGSDATRFIIGGSTMKENSVYPKNFNYKKVAVFSTINHHSKNEKFKLAFSANFGNDQNILPSVDLIRSALTLPPNAPEIFNEQGELNWEESTWENPFSALENTYRNKTNSLISHLNIDYKLVNEINLKLNIGYTINRMEEIKLRPHTAFNPAYGLTSESSVSYKNNAGKDSWIIEPQIDFNLNPWNNKLNILIGSSFQQNQFNQLSLIGIGFPTNELIENLSAATDLISGSETGIQYKYLGLFARVNYNLKEKYIINLTGRRDGSSRFGPNNRFSNFGAVGLAWIFSKELFMEKLSWLSLGKTRLTYGITGNDQIGDYKYYNTYTISDYLYDNNIGLNPTQLYNPNYSWEKNKKFEAGLEIGLFRNRLNLTLNYYLNKSNNQLMQIPLPSTTGFNSINSNLDAGIENTGIEIHLDTNLMDKQHFKWMTTFQFSSNKNRLKSFKDFEKSTYYHTLILGEALNIYKLYNVTGVNGETGLFEFEDYNGDGIISGDYDKNLFVNLNPQFQISWRNSITYRHWNLDFLFQYVKKDILNELFGTSPMGTMTNQPVIALDEIQQVYTAGYNYPAYSTYNRFTQSQKAVSDGSFLRLKSLTFSYTIPSEKSERLKLYFEGQNILTLTKYKGRDPEQSIGFLPPMKRLSFGFSFQF